VVDVHQNTLNLIEIETLKLYDSIKYSVRCLYFACLHFNSLYWIIANLIRADNKCKLMWIQINSEFYNMIG